jgi:uncharacterized membrane protein YecN with MAPEG domain
MHPVHLAATTATLGFLPDTYGYVLIVAALIALELLLIGFIVAGGARGKYFTKEFMERHFGEAHREATGQEIDKGGSPDMGSGFYSQRLSYKEWYEFNNAQRSHYNFLEFAPTTFVWLFVAGVYFPIASAVLGVVVLISRFLYAVGYSKNGPKGRIAGVLGNDLALLGLLGLSLASGIMFVLGRTAI